MIVFLPTTVDGFVVKWKILNQFYWFYNKIDGFMQKLMVLHQNDSFFFTNICV